jgi:hypothetical protein
MKHLASLLFMFSALSLFATDAHAKRQFCLSIRYWWFDANIGEDYLAIPDGGGQWANKVWLVLRRDGNTVWSGYADSGATTKSCTPELDTPSGEYHLRAKMAFRPQPSTDINIWQDSSEDWYWYTKNFGQLDPTIGTVMHTMNIGYQFTTVWDITNIGAYVSRFGQNLDFGLVPGTIRVHANGPASDYNSSTNLIRLGNDPLYGGHYRSKWTVGHEFGHAIDDLGVGAYPGSTSYGDASSVAECNCAYISTSESHCLQSREHIAAAIFEGWGHFSATRVLNNPADSSAWFGYYKKSLSFSNPGNPPIDPPRAISVVPSTPYRWMENRSCDASDKGVEVDWLGFWYKVNTQTTNQFSFADLRSIYQSMCGGTCLSNNSAHSPTWDKLQDAAVAVFLPGKASAFANRGDDFGVDH